MCVIVPACTPPSGYTTSSGGKHYRSVGSSKFLEAEAECKSERAWLAMPKTAAEFDTIRRKQEFDVVIARKDFSMDQAYHAKHYRPSFRSSAVCIH